MEEYSQPGISTPEPSRQLLMLLNSAVVLLFIISALLIFLTAAGHSTVHFEGLPADAAIRLNGHAVTASVLKLRPGSYQVLIASPAIMPYQGTLNVGLLRTITYKPAIKQRSADAIASAVIGAVPGTSEPPQFSSSRWFEDNTWAAGVLSPTQIIFVFHYDKTSKTWSVAYSDADGYPNSTSALPAAVAAYIQPSIAHGGVR